MWHVNTYLPDRLEVNLKNVLDQTQLGTSDMLRRMIDYCLQQQRMNDIVPSMSGQIKIGS